MKLMLCETGSERDLEDPRYAAELKADGTHIRVRKQEGTIGIYGRPKKSGEIPDYTLRLPEIIEAAEALPASNFELVGEAVVFDDKGKTWFEGSQRRCSTQSAAKIPLLKVKYPVVLLAFDLTLLDGKNLEGYAWEERKALLRNLIYWDQEDAQRAIQYLPHFEDKREYFDKVVDKGEEGVILKKRGSQYIRRRSKNWLKVKQWITERCLVVGYTEGTGRREDTFGSLILAQEEGKYLKYVGKVGTGFDDDELEQIAKILRDGETLNKIVDARDANKKPVKHTPVNVELEVTVKFFEMSKNGVFRFPSLLKDANGSNLIHFGASSIEGKPRQTNLASLLKSLT